MTQETSKYIFEPSGRSSHDRYFDPGAFVPDLADQLTRETGNGWVYHRHEADDHYNGRWHSCGVKRVRDGLTVNIGRGAWNKPLRGEVSIDWLKSGCGQYVRNDHRAKTTFCPCRDINTIAKQIMRAVVTPSEAYVKDYRTAQTHRDNTAAFVSLQLQALANMPEVQVNRNGMADQAYVSIGDFTFRVDNNGSATTERHSIDLGLLPDLAEFLRSRSRQMV